VPTTWAARCVRRRDEHGAMLVMCLVVVILMSTVGVAVLDLQGVTARAQETMREKRTVDLTADAHLDEAIAALRTDRRFGVDDPNITGAACNDRTREDELTGAHETGGYVVTCQPVEGSGLLVGDAGNPPESSILVLGGIAPDGNDEANTSKTIDGTPTVEEVDDYIPFCDDWHSRVSTTCEAGLYVGRVDDANAETSGLLVADNGSNSGQPAVRSNSSIVVMGGQPARSLKVEGPDDAPDIFARRSCMGGSYGTVIEDWDPATNSGDSTPDLCDQGGPLIPDPAYRPAPVQWTDKPLDRTGPGGTSEITCGNYGTRVTAFEPGWYTNGEAMNNLMRFCESLFWFKPGVYYFDFDGDEVSWIDPRLTSRIVGGTPIGWTPESGPQPPKEMTGNGTTTQAWDSSPTFAFKRDGTNLATNTVAQGQSGMSRLGLTNFATPVPELASTSISKVELKVAHNAPSPVQSYRPADGLGLKFPRVEITIPNVGTCYIELAKGDHIALPETLDVTTCNDGSGRKNHTGTWPGKGATTWTASLVNSMRVEYQVDRCTVSQAVCGAPVPTITADSQVDAMNIWVTYRGAPSPPYPGACDPTKPGVQFIFGNLSRMVWTGNPASIELCGSDHDGDGNDLAIAVYGVPDADHALGPNRGVVTWFSPDQTKNQLPGDGTSNLFQPANGNTIDHTLITRIGDGLSVSTGRFDQVAHPRLWFRIRDDLVCDLTDPADPCGPGQIPTGSVIDRVELRVRHGEGYHPDDPRYGGTYGTAVIDKVYLGIEVGDRNRWHGEASSDWTTDEPESRVPMLANGRRSIPPCDDDTMTVSGPADCSERTWGIRTLPDGSGYEKWNDHRTLSEALRTPEGLQNARILYEVVTNTAGAPKFAALDGIELTVEYRPPRQLRPLRGCLTIRPAVNPEAPAAAGDWHPYRGMEMLGTDRDWGANSPLASDSAYRTGTNEGVADNVDCALIRIAQPSKMHVEGSIYAPTAAFDFSGWDNEASFSSQGIVARHLTAWRWKKGPAVPFVGGWSGVYAPRTMILRVYKDGHLIAECRCVFDDANGVAPGKKVDEAERKRRP